MRLDKKIYFRVSNNDYYTNYTVSFSPAGVGSSSSNAVKRQKKKRNKVTHELQKFNCSIPSNTLLAFRYKMFILLHSLCF